MFAWEVWWFSSLWRETKSKHWILFYRGGNAFFSRHTFITSAFQRGPSRYFRTHYSLSSNMRCRSLTVSEPSLKYNNLRVELSSNFPEPCSSSLSGPLFAFRSNHVWRVSTSPKYSTSLYLLKAPICTLLLSRFIHSSAIFRAVALPLWAFGCSIARKAARLPTVPSLLHWAKQLALLGGQIYGGIYLFM